MKKVNQNSNSIFNDYELNACPTKSEYFSTDVYYGMSFARVGPQTVISRSKDGKPISRFVDDEWFLPAFAFNVTDNPYFSFLPFYKDCDFNSHNAEVCKKLFLMKMFSPNSKTGVALRIPSMHVTRHVLLNMAEFCALRKWRLEELFSSVDKFKAFQVSIEHQSKNRALVALVRTLNGMSSDERGFPLDGLVFPYMQKAAKKIRSEGQQFPIIPSRILLFKYEQYQSYINDFLMCFNNISAFLDRSADNPLYGKHKDTHKNPECRGSKANAAQLAAHLDNPISFQDAIRENGLREMSGKYNWRSAPHVLGFLTKVSHCAKNLIHLFTLMRDHEVKSLKVDCLEPVRGWNNDALYVAGITTKLYSAAKPRQWITTDAILKPVDALSKIREILNPYINNSENYLLISTAVHPVATTKPSRNKIKKTSVEHLLEPINITEDDIQELEAVDPLRNWRADPRFKIGMPWRITSHQFRRTMAVFCAQTGLITLPSLKRLLGHLTKVMSLYYTKGCSADNYYFNLINPELAEELRKAKFEADGAMFIREVLHSTDKLFGIKGSEIMSQRSSSVWVSRAVEETVLLASQGLIAHTETPLGGCASPTPCDKRAHGNFFTCPGCRHLIGKDSVLNDTLAIMEFDLAELDPVSMEYKAEKQNLEDFIELRNRLISKAS
ncbi:integrase [Pseudomonas umsongensis]|uniref:integrase n=1 Tax=Pseudomonas umsongensis TaxID=198618 RepID=UPI0015BC09C0|nr:integrase [Pseudomonas umsongensis]NWL21888.1 integrase [Pseudomonas umsongensis]